jgi:phosphoribosylamine--glycine ligase
VPADVNDPRALIDVADSFDIDLTVVGPEAPLVAGVADLFSSRKRRLVGPTREAAQLEGSKIFAKRFMQRNRIPTAPFVECDTPDRARAALGQFDFPVVIKADGLAAGKGVRIVQDKAEFDAAIRESMVDRIFGDAGARVLIEECLTGEEASLMLFTDGRDFKVLAPARDYKRVYDGDEGPNTGGMGSFSTPGLIDDAACAQIVQEIVESALLGMQTEGRPFAGVLYVGLMLTADGPRVIEFNARLGDPETQAVLMRLDSDLVEIFNAIAEGRIGSQRVEWSGDSTVCVVATSGGYPGKFEKGKPIEGLDRAQSVEGVQVFHAGTARDAGGALVTSGGRVLGITSRANTLAEARKRAYEAVSLIRFDEMHYRRDIAARF